MAVTRITIVTPDAKEADQGFINAAADSRTALGRLGDFIQAIATGAKQGKVRLNTGAVQAVGTIAFSSFVADDTVTINGNVLTGKATPSGANQFAVGSVDEDVANNLVAKVNASALATIPGVIYAYRRGTVLLSSFATADYVTINGVRFTGKTTPTDTDPRQFAIGGTDAKTAENLMNAINACAALYPDQLGAKLLSVSRSTATLTINYDGSMTLAVSAHGTATSKTVVFLALAGGTGGNLMTLAVSAHGTAVTPVGGTEGTETVFAISRTIL